MAHESDPLSKTVQMASVATLFFVVFWFFSFFNLFGGGD